MIPAEKDQRLAALIGQTVRLQPLSGPHAGVGFKGLCPFHNEITPSFTVRDDLAEYRCLSCGAHGDIDKWQSESARLMSAEAARGEDAACDLTPPPMRNDQPPINGGWILAYDTSLHEFARSRPWVIATRTDEGFADENGYPVEVMGWCLLPDPQPQMTNWSVPAGTVKVCRAHIALSGWAGWMTYFVRPDGTDDSTRYWVFKDESEADEKAQWYAERYGLSVEKDRAEGPWGTGKVVPFPTRKGGER